MQVISTSDFQNWKQDGVTIAFMQTLAVRIEELMYVLSTQAGLDSNEDCKLRGYITAFRDILATDFDDVQEGL